MIIRAVTENDVASICAIYSDAVLNGVASFEDVPSDETEILKRMTALVDGGFPYIVAEIDGVVVGYAYASAFRPRSAYRFTLEDSVYISPDQQGKGIGKALLLRLLLEGKERGFNSMMAGIGGASPASMALHKKCGFELVGIGKQVGFKFGQWQDLVYMQKMFN